MDKGSCFYTAQGQLTCQKEPLYVDTTGSMRKRPVSQVFWDNVFPTGRNGDPACFSDLPCCKPDPKNDNLITKDISCKPYFCCEHMIKQESISQESVKK
jgi:hypothetical protein